jgi:hypothetical protein
VLFHSTVAPAANPVPVTVKVNAAPPAATLEGEMLMIVGAESVIVNGTLFDGGPDGFTKLTCTVPGCIIAVAGTDAVTCVAL